MQAVAISRAKGEGEENEGNGAKQHSTCKPDQHEEAIRRVDYVYTRHK
jgi:hypothetical protein